MRTIGEPSKVVFKDSSVLVSRLYTLLNGVDEYYLLENAIDVDRVVMTVCPLSGGNVGLPTGAPAVTDNEFQTIDFAYSGQLQEIGKNGASFFHGYIANVQLWKDGDLVFSHPFNTDLSSTQLPNTVGGV